MNLRPIVAIVLCGLGLAACNGQQAKDQELALKEKELELRERELKLADSSGVGTAPAAAAPTAQSAAGSAAKPPFVGRKNFETEPGASGTGTPQRYLELAANGDAYFSFSQQNQANGVVTTERYFAGKFQPYLKCVFTKLDNEVRYYHVEADKIEQVDANLQPLRSADCCPVSSSAESCPCASGYY